MRYIFIVLWLVGATSSAYGQYYYGDNGRVPLRIDTTVVQVRLDFDETPVLFNDFVENLFGIAGLADRNVRIDSFVTCSINISTDYLLVRDSLERTPGITSIEPVYLGSRDRRLYVGETFIVAFDSSLGREGIASINTRLGASIVRERQGRHNVFILRKGAGSDLPVYH